MKKEAIKRGLLGFPLGICIGYIITIIISLIWAGGYYSAYVPELAQAMGSEIKAVIFQTVLSGILGAGFATASIIWEVENWGMMKQTGMYFMITSLLMFPIACLARWMNRSLLGFAFYFAIFIMLFVVIWVIQYIIWKNKINKINLNLTKK